MSYPSILHLRKIPEIFALRSLVVMEKIHGTGAKIVVKEGRVTVGIAGEHHPGQRTFLQDHPLLEERLKELGDVCFYGEYAGEGVVQKMIKYGSPDFFPFDVEINGALQDYGRLQQYAEQVGFTMAPLLAQVHEGRDVVSQQPVNSLDDFFEELRNRPSELARIRNVNCPDNIQEGIVIKSNPPQKCQGGYLIAKLKSDRYREESGEKVHPTNTTLLYAFAVGYVNENRIMNIISHGIPITKSKKDIPQLIELAFKDLVKEEKEDMDELRKNFSDAEMRTTVGSVVAKVYTAMLKKNQIA